MKEREREIVAVKGSIAKLFYVFPQQKEQQLSTYLFSFIQPEFVTQDRREREREELAFCTTLFTQNSPCEHKRKLARVDYVPVFPLESEYTGATRGKRRRGSFWKVESAASGEEVVIMVCVRACRETTHTLGTLHPQQQSPFLARGQTPSS